MEWLIRFPWGPLIFSTVISVTACIAILGFGLAPKMQVPIAWGTCAGCTALSSWVERRLGRR
jgi:hypothetical protein